MSILDGIVDLTMNGLQKSLELTWRRNEALSSNISNAETPLYRATDLNFAGELEKAFKATETTLTRTDARHLDVGEAGTAHLISDFSGETKADGNNVDINIQMGKLAYNSEKFSLYSNFMGRKFSNLKRAINEAK